MDIPFSSIPLCILHNKPIIYMCASPHCKVPNPMICDHNQCTNSHSHPINQIISVNHMKKLVSEHTVSMSLLISKSKEYYEEVRQIICHEVHKRQQLMCQALAYKYTHPVLKKLREERYGQISSLKLYQLISHLRGATEEKSSLENIKNQIYKEMEGIKNNLQAVFESIQFKKSLLFHLVDLSTINPKIKLQQLNTTIIHSQQELESISTMLISKYPKSVTNWNLLYKASEFGYSSSAYRSAIFEKGPLLMIFITDKHKKFGCFLNCNVNKKEGWLTDGTGHSFIFSLDRNQTFQIRHEAKYRVKTLYMGEKGPQIGLGCDIYISNDCNVDGKSGSNLGGSFEVPSNMFYGSREAKQYLCGEENFYIEDYEVFQIN